MPERLFKYAKRAHSELLVRNGRIRLGTLFDFQNVERHGTMIADEDEGRKNRFDNPVTTRASGLSPFAHSIVRQVIPNMPSGAVFSRCYFTQPERSPNCRLYCTSLHLSAQTMQSMESEYDSCVQINSVQSFFEAVGDELHRLNLVTKGQVVRVKYRIRSLHYLLDDGLPGWALKAPKYAAQEEVRFVYFPVKPITVKCLDLKIPKLRGFCELVQEIPE